MAVAFNAASSNGNGGVTSISTTHTAAGSDRFALIGVIAEGSVTVSSVTYGGVACTLVHAHSNGDSGVRLYRIIAPATTAGATVQANFSGASSRCAIAVVSFTGVDQTTPLGTAADAETATGTATVNVSSAATELVCDLLWVADVSATVGAGQTARVNVGDIAEMGRTLGMSTEVGGATTTMSWTHPNTSADAFIIAVGIREAAGASTVTKTPTTGNLSLGGLVASHNAFNHVRIRDVLISESGQPIANATNITLKVWYSGYIAGPADFSRNSYTTDANGTASWSITRGSLVSGQTILYVAQDSLSFSNYTMGRMVPSYEA
jgi:hypothetical protein